jgi:hypothetical protein
MCRNRDIALIARPRLLPLLTTFMLDHHGQSVQFEAALVGQTFTAWRCRAD